MNPVSSSIVRSFECQIPNRSGGASRLLALIASAILFFSAWGVHASEAFHDLVTAVVTRDLDRVETALKAGANPNLVHQNDPRLGRSSNTVLGVAVEMGQTEIVESLLKAGARASVSHEIELENRYMKLDLVQLAIMKGSIPTLRLLLNSGAVPNMQSWITAFKRSNLEAARLMYRAGARIPKPEGLASPSALSFLPSDADFVKGAVTELGVTGEHVPWLQLARDGAYKKLDLFIGLGLRIRQGLFAPEHELPQFLKRASASVNPSESEVRYVQDGVGYLLSAGADPRALAIDSTYGGSAAPLHYAVMFGDPGVLEKLLSAGVDPNQEDGWGRTPMMLISGRGATFNREKFRSDREEIIKMLLSSGANINAVNQQAANERGLGETALIAAFPNVDIVRLLLQYGANPNVKLKGGETALFKAATAPAWSCGRMGEIVDLLLQNGADHNHVNQDGENALHRALDQNKKHQFCELSAERLLKAGGDFNRQREKDGVTPFMLFAKRYSAERVLNLAKKHSSLEIDLEDEQGRTALFYYFFSHGESDANKCGEGFKVFAQLGADINHRDASGKTLLSYAEKDGPNDTSSTLRSLGATEAPSGSRPALGSKPAVTREGPV